MIQLIFLVFIYSKCWYLCSICLYKFVYSTNFGKLSPWSGPIAFIPMCLDKAAHPKSKGKCRILKFFAFTIHHVVKTYANAQLLARICRSTWHNAPVCILHHKCAHSTLSFMAKPQSALIRLGCTIDCFVLMCSFSQ